MSKEVQYTQRDPQCQQQPKLLFYHNDLEKKLALAHALKKLIVLAQHEVHSD